MQNIKQRNLYLPILHKTKFFQNKQQNNASSYQNNQKNSVNDLLKLIQKKKAQLQKNIDNQESDDSSDNEDNNNVQSNQSFNNKFKILSLQHSKLNKIHQKIKTTVDQRSQSSEGNHTQLKTRHFRVRTQHNQNSSKSTQNQSNLKRIKQPVQKPKPQIKFLNPKQMSKQMIKLIPNIPTKMKQRNQDTLKGLVQFLQQQNPFFMKLDRIVATCLLKVCKIVQKSKKQKIYDRQTVEDRFYIILSGRVKISNSEIDLKKVCVPGQTILEQTWINFSQNRQIVQTTQKARAVGTTYLLQIPLSKFKKVKQQLTKFGFKPQYNQLQALIKRNYIHKNAIRKQKNKF